jgi:hypothetical protein
MLHYRAARRVIEKIKIFNLWVLFFEIITIFAEN